MLVRAGQTIESTRISITLDAAACTPVVKGSVLKQGFAFTTSNTIAGDKLLVSWTSGCKQQTATVDASKVYVSPKLTKWSNASAVIVREGVALEATRATLSGSRA